MVMDKKKKIEEKTEMIPHLISIPLTRNYKSRESSRLAESTNIIDEIFDSNNAN